VLSADFNHILSSSYAVLASHGEMLSGCYHGRTSGIGPVLLVIPTPDSRDSGPWWRDACDAATASPPAAAVFHAAVIVSEMPLYKKAVSRSQVARFQITRILDALPTAELCCGLV
jgi:hypothetical protein